MKERLRTLRIESGLTQKQLAQKLNSTNKNIWAYENGLATPPIDVLNSYADTFNVSVDYLLGRTDDFGVALPVSQKLPDDELELLRLYRILPPEFRRSLLNSARLWADEPVSASDKKRHKKNSLHMQRVPKYSILSFRYARAALQA